MRIDVLTLFPTLIEAFFSESILRRAVEAGLIEYRTVDIRDFAGDRHRTCDDAPYGGGAGMVLKPEPLGAALDSVGARELRTVYPTPSGRPFTQAVAWELSQEEHLVFICGRYEGVDQRIIDYYVDDELTIGDYVVSSGELSALVIIDAATRLVDGVIRADSLSEESFTDGLLEYPQYTRPELYKGMRVPEVLLTGHHERIRRWRHEKRIEKTKMFRADLLECGPRENDEEDNER
ncbi:MAG: tRNA (guanosine(37)-N1)-methyltransferase TrmD [Spirochaetaceae bacterium]